MLSVCRESAPAPPPAPPQPPKSTAAAAGGADKAAAKSPADKSAAKSPAPAAAGAAAGAAATPSTPAAAAGGGGRGSGGGSSSTAVMGAAAAPACGTSRELEPAATAADMPVPEYGTVAWVIDACLTLIGSRAFEYVELKKAMLQAVIIIITGNGAKYNEPVLFMRILVSVGWG